MDKFSYMAEPDMCIRERKLIYEYITVYIDDLVIAAKHPKDIKDIMMDKHEFKLKSTGIIKYHLECDFFGDENATHVSCQRNILRR